MLRKYIDFFNKFIYYTKKFYFFHILTWCLTPALIFSLICIFSLPSYLYDFITSHTTKEIISNIQEDIAVIYLSYAYLSVWGIIIALFGSLIVESIQYSFLKKYFVFSKFLLNNKYYNFFYIFSLFALLVSWTILFNGG